MAEPDDEHVLMQRIAKGDTTAYRTLLEKHLGQSLRFAERMLGNRHDAEDIVQEAYLKIWHEASHWEPRAKFSTWLYRVIYNACLNQRRKHIRLVHSDMSQLVDTAHAADEVLMQQQRSEAVRYGLQLLPDRQRAAIVLSYYEGMADKESAELLGVSPGAFQQLLFRARQALRVQLNLKNAEQGNG